MKPRTQTAQSASNPHQHHPELERVMTEFFRSVSFQEGERPAYDKLHDLFIEGGMLIKNGPHPPEISSVREFIGSREKLVAAGQLIAFEEVERGANTEAFGNVAHRLSTYEKRGTLGGNPFAGRGVISTQFVKALAGWRITSMAWDDERPGLALPDRYERLGADTP